MSNDPTLPAAAFLSRRHKRLLIDGRWVEAEGGRTFQAVNPANGTVLGELQEGGTVDVDRAVAAAKTAFEGAWGAVKPDERQKILLRAADIVEARFEEISVVETLDVGTPLPITRANKQRMTGMLRFYAGFATTMVGETIPNSIAGNYVTYTMKEPVGVVGGITPWNSPMTQFVIKVGPALATGCTVVLKPAEQASLSSLLLGEMFCEAGVPPGVLNIVTGMGPVAGAALARHPDVDKVAFTGSDVTGQDIIRASAGNVKRLSLELGGKSPDIVFDDADLDEAVPGAVLGAFLLSGQSCSAGTRLFVQRGIYDAFMSRLRDYVAGLRSGDGMVPGTDLGPIISDRQFQRIQGYIDAGRQEGAELLCGGGRLTGGGCDGGLFMQPTLFAGVTDQMRIAREEIFGPVLVVFPFDTVEEVVRRANDSRYGLGSGIWSRDLKQVMRVAGKLRAGSVWVNCYNTRDPAVPFGGYKMSGMGRDGGSDQMEGFLQTKSVIIAC